MTRRNHCDICKTRHGAACRASDRTWPMQPLAAAARTAMSTTDAAKALGLSGERFAALCEHGIPDRTADRLAIRIGRHPAMIWGTEWVDAALSVVDRQRLEGGWRQAWEHAEQHHEEAVA